MNEGINFDIDWEEIIKGPNNTGGSIFEFVPQNDFDVSTLFDFDMPPATNDSLQQNTGNSESEHRENNENEFVELSSNDVNLFICDQENKNTQRKTLCDVLKFQRFLRRKNELREMQNIDPEMLDEYIANFCLSVRKADGSDFEPSSLRNIVSSIDRKLKRHKYPHRIIGDNTNTFQLTRDALNAKLKSLKRAGKGNKPNNSSPITDTEINMLYNKNILGGSNGKSLLNTIWFNNCVLFGLRGTKENYNLRWGDVQLCMSSDGSEYIELTERQTKTRNGQNTSDVREVTPKIYELPDDPSRCPVQMYKLYESKRPKDFCKPEDPFYIAPRTNSQTKDSSWFNKMTVGEKKIGSLLKVMAQDGGLDVNKHLTNHSTRKHLVQKLRDSGVAPTDIMQISGHKNIQSVLNYSSMSEETHRKCSNLLSNTRQPSSTITTETQNRYENALHTNPVPQSPVLQENPVNSESTMAPQASQQLRNGSQGQVTLTNNTMNSNLNALFRGATLNIQNFNVYFK